MIDKCKSKNPLSEKASYEARVFCASAKSKQNLILQISLRIELYSIQTS